MRVLVCAASRHGATTEIAERILSVLKQELSEDGKAAEVELRAPENVTGIGGYDAVVIGSAVYRRRWLPSARRFVNSHATALSARPVWLFSSGPIGPPVRPEEDPSDAAQMVTATGALEHRVFSGRLDRRRLGLWERIVVLALRGADGDFRNWAAIEAWAATIAADLRVITTAPIV